MAIADLLATGFWTANHLLVFLNVVLAAAALATAFVGLRTIKSSNRVAAAAEDALAASVQPLLVSVVNARGNTALVWNQDADPFVVGVPVMNIGPGPAIIHNAELTTGSGSVKAASDKKIIPQGAAATVWATLPSEEVMNSALQNETLVAGVMYSDLADGQRTESVITLSGSARWALVHTIEIFECDDSWNRGASRVASGVPPH